MSSCKWVQLRRDRISSVRTVIAASIWPAALSAASSASALL